MKCLYKQAINAFFWQNLCKKNSQDDCNNSLCNVSLHQLSRRGVLANSLPKRYERSQKGALAALADLNRCLCTRFQQRRPGNIPVQDLYQGSPGKTLQGSLHTRSLQKIVVVPVHSAPVPFERSLEQDCCCLQVSVHDSCRRSPGRTPVQNLDQSSVGRMRIRGCCGKISLQTFFW